MPPQWLSRQFEQHLPGMEPEPRRNSMTKAVYNPWSEEHRGLQSETVQRVTALGPRQGVGMGSHVGGNIASTPVGMRGSIPERVGLSHRLERKRAGEGRWESLRTRMQDEDGSDYEDYEEPEPHPTTGLPSYGNINTYDPMKGRRNAWAELHAEREPHIGFESGNVPHGLSFHGSAPSARRKHGSVEEIPVPGLATVQPTVSLARVHEALDNPETTASPRFPASHKELPHVYEDAGKYTMIDGNHRASAHMLGQQMFMQAKVLRNKDIPAVGASTNRISRAKSMAALNPKVDTSEVENRLMRNVYGSNY